MGLLTIWRRSICAVSGAIAAGLAGMLFGIAQQPATPPLAWADLLRAVLLLGGVGWLAVLLVVGIWLRYGLTAMALPSLVTALLSSAITLLLANLTYVGPLAGWIGLVVGTLVGALLCRACYEREHEGGRIHGLR